MLHTDFKRNYGTSFQTLCQTTKNWDLISRCCQATVALSQQKGQMPQSQDQQRCNQHNSTSGLSASSFVGDNKKHSKSIWKTIGKTNVYIWKRNPQMVATFASFLSLLEKCLWMPLVFFRYLGSKSVSQLLTWRRAWVMWDSLSLVVSLLPATKMPQKSERKRVTNHSSDSQKFRCLPD